MDGDWWHAFPGKYKASDLICSKNGKRVTAQQIWDKDEKVNIVLRNEKYIVLRFWEHEIHKNIEYCISKIKENLS